MLVSVIIVSKNSERTIERCLDSVLLQNYRDTEIVVVDGSEDGTKEVLESYAMYSFFPIKIVYQNPQGVGSARNLGLEHVNGEVVCFIDADEWIDFSFIEKVAKRFSENPYLLTIQPKMIQIQPRGLFSNLVYLYESAMHYDEYHNEQYIANPFVARKKLFSISGLYGKIGMFREDLESGEDTEMIYRLAKRKTELEILGYKFETLDTVSHFEEKQGIDFKSYWKKCVWYGRALANKSYFFSSPLKNLAKMVMGMYFIALPLSVVAFSQWWVYLTMPLVVLWLYIALKLVAIGRFSFLVLFMPIVVLYKFVFLFLGIIEELWKAK